MNIETLLNTGLTQAELGRVFGVSRITINAWMRGRFAPHRLHREHIKAQGEKLAQALAAGKLPIPGSVPKSRRPEAIAEALGELT